MNFTVCGSTTSTPWIRNL